MRQKIFQMTTLLMTSILLLEVSYFVIAHEFKNNIDDDKPEIVPYRADEEYIRHIHSMIDAYKSGMMGGKLFLETNALINTKYKTWKRNADLINSLLALPKGMNDAGR